MIGNEEDERVSVKIEVDAFLDLGDEGINVTLLVGEESEHFHMVSYDKLFKQLTDACSTDGKIPDWDRDFMIDVAKQLRDLADRIDGFAGVE